MHEIFSNSKQIIVVDCNGDSRPSTLAYVEPTNNQTNTTPSISKAHAFRTNAVIMKSTSTMPHTYFHSHSNMAHRPARIQNPDNFSICIAHPSPESPVLAGDFSIEATPALVPSPPWPPFFPRFIVLHWRFFSTTSLAASAWSYPYPP